MLHTSVLPSRPARPLSVAALWNLITTEHADVLDDRQMIIQCPRTRSLPYLGKDTLRICQHPFLFTRFHYIIIINIERGQIVVLGLWRARKWGSGLCPNYWGRRWTAVTVSQVMYDTSLVVIAAVLIAEEDYEMFMTRSRNVTPNTTEQRI